VATEPLRRSSLIRLAIVVEGETEEEFVKNILAEYLPSCGVVPPGILPLPKRIRGRKPPLVREAGRSRRG